jgi:arylsulfatase A-like enzyme
MRALYDGEIRYTDDALQSFFEELDGLWIAAPLVVVTADHGEILEEHARDFQHAYFHGKFPFNESLRVPLVWHWPGHLPAGRRDAPVDITGLGPTLVDLLFGGGFAGGVPSFASAVREDAPGDTAVFALAPRLYPEETMQPGWEFRRHETWSILRWPWHLIYNPERRSALYDVATDPLELTDLAAAHPERVAALEREVIEHFRAQPRAEEGAVPVSAELREQLRELGYVE